MKIAFKWTLVLMLGVAFWFFYDYGRASRGCFHDLDPASFAGLAAWLCACWAGMLMRWKTNEPDAS